MWRFDRTAVLALLTITAPAQAQAWQCRPPVSVKPAPALQRPADEPARRVKVTGHVLALSWSPEFCRTRKTDAPHRMQCGRQMGEFGFILHGLWPQGKGGRWPQWCRRVGALTEKIVRSNLCSTPSPRLLQHEWAKHGSCLTKGPQSYFTAGRIMFQAIEFPDMDRLSRSRPSARVVKQAFAAANPGLNANMMRLKVNSRGWLQEVRLCLDLRFRPTRCDGRGGALPDAQEVKIWRGD